jgi:hypothetical protein
MIALGSRKRWCIGSWILAALLLAGVNGFKLMSLFNPIVVGCSDEIRLASQKWKQFEILNSLIRNNPIDFDFKLAFLKFIPGSQTRKKTASKLQQIGGAVEKKADKIKLPILTGVIGFAGVHGNERLLAVIEGRTYRKKDPFQDFTIKEITSKGVVLQKADATWFVPVPEVYFSMDRSELTGQKQSQKQSEFSDEKALSAETLLGVNPEDM